MKSSRMIFLLMGVVMSVAIQAINVEEYVTGNKVDSEGKNILHKLAENCDNDDLQFEIKPFDGTGAKVALEGAFLVQSAEIILQLPEEQLALFLLQHIAAFVHMKDNKGDTPLDILNRKTNQKNPCVRYLAGKAMLQQFHSSTRPFRR